MAWPKEIIDFFKAETQAYDELDPEIRWLIANMPMPLFSTPSILLAEKHLGKKQTADLIKQKVAEEFPAFKWPSK